MVSRFRWYRCTTLVFGEKRVSLIEVIMLVSLIATTAPYVALLWVIRHYNRYSYGIMAIAITIAAIATWNSLWTGWAGDNMIILAGRPHLATHKVWYDVLVVFMSVMIIKCGISVRYIKSKVCDT